MFHLIGLLENPRDGFHKFFPRMGSLMFAPSNLRLNLREQTNHGSGGAPDVPRGMWPIVPTNAS